MQSLSLLVLTTSATFDSFFFLDLGIHGSHAVMASAASHATMPSAASHATMPPVPTCPPMPPVPTSQPMPPAPTCPPITSLVIHPDANRYLTRAQTQSVYEMTKKWLTENPAQAATCTAQQVFDRLLAEAIQESMKIFEDAQSKIDRLKTAPWGEGTDDPNFSNRSEWKSVIDAIVFAASIVSPPPLKQISSIDS